MRFAITFLVFATSIHAQGTPPVESDTLRNRGFELERAGKYREAIEIFQRVAALTPNEPAIHQVLGSAYLHLYVPGDERPDNIAMASRAEAEFRRSVDLKANNSSALNGLISLKYGQRKFTEAAEWASRLIAASPGNKLGHYWAGALFAAELEVALKNASSAERADMAPGYSARIDDAIAHLRRAVALDPTYEAAMTSLSGLLRSRADLRATAELAQPDIDQSVRWQQRAAEAHKTNSEMKFQRISIGGDIQMANVLRKPLPVCPAGVRASDKVRLTIVIAKDGEVQDVNVISGDERLVPSVVEAVGSWVFKPSLLENRPVEVITQVDVNMNCGK